MGAFLVAGPASPQNSRVSAAKPGTVGGPVAFWHAAGEDRVSLLCDCHCGHPVSQGRRCNAAQRALVKGEWDLQVPQSPNPSVLPLYLFQSTNRRFAHLRFLPSASCPLFIIHLSLIDQLTNRPVPQSPLLSPTQPTARPEPVKGLPAALVSPSPTHSVPRSQFLAAHCPLLAACCVRPVSLSS